MAESSGDRQPRGAFHDPPPAKPASSDEFASRLVGRSGRCALRIEPGRTTGPAPFGTGPAPSNATRGIDPAGQVRDRQETCEGSAATPWIVRQRSAASRPSAAEQTARDRADHVSIGARITALVTAAIVGTIRVPPTIVTGPGAIAVIRARLIAAFVARAVIPLRIGGNWRQRGGAHRESGGEGQRFEHRLVSRIGVPGGMARLR